MVQLVTMMKVMTKRGKAGEARRPARRNEVTQRRESTASSTPVQKTAFRCIGAREIFLCHCFEIYRCGLSVAGLADSDVEDSRPAARPLLRPPRTRINVFVRTCSSVSSWRLCVGLMLTAPSMNVRLGQASEGMHRLRAWCLIQRRLLRVLAGQPP